MSHQDDILNSKIKDILKDNNNFDNIFMKKMKKIYSKHQTSQLTHSNYFNSHSNNKIRLETSLKANQMINNSKSTYNYNRTNNNSKNIKKSNSSLEEDEIRASSKNSKKNKQISPRDNNNLLKEKNSSISGDMNRINKYSFIQAVISNQGNYSHQHNIKSANTSKSKSKPKKNNLIKGYLYTNLTKKANPQMIIKYGNSKKISTKNSNINIYNPYEPTKIEYKKLSKTAYQTKNNSRKNSTEKKRKNENLHYHHNHFDEHSDNTSKNYSNQNNSGAIAKSIEINNYILSSSKNKNDHHNSLGNSSLNFIKNKNQSINNHYNNNNHNLSGNIFHVKGLSEIPINKIILYNNNTNNSKLIKPGHFIANSKKYINVNDIKYIEYINSNVKNNNSTKNTSSLSNISSKKKDESDKDYLQMKFQNKFKNTKLLTTVHSKQNSKSSSRIEEYSNNIITHSKPLDISKNNFIKKNIPYTACQSPSSKIQKTKKNPLKNNLVKRSLELGSQNNIKKSSIQSIKNINFDILKREKQTNLLNLNISNHKKEHSYNISRKEVNNILLDKENNQIAETQSLQSTIREPAYYRKEMEKISNYIKQFHYTNGKYPGTKVEFYKYGRRLGKGAFGKVNLALHICSGHLVAIKSFNKKKLKREHDRKKVQHEISILSKLHHPFVSKILDSFKTEKHILIILEYICGDLLNFIRKRSKLSESTSKIIFKQLMEGLKYIHSKNIVHRDIKLDNILIDLSNTIKICDFGVSREILPGDIMHEHCGTPAYIAPEIFKNNGYEGFGCDVWSAGVSLYYMLGGIQPFKGNNINELKKCIISGKYDKLENVSDEVNDLIDGMLQVDVKKRFSVNQVLNHPWLFGVNINNRFNANLFTSAEKVLLSKYNVDYLNCSKEEIIENFTIKNLDTLEEEKKLVGNTKSLILAPYNSYALTNDYLIQKGVCIENDICKFGGKAQQANLKYELNNNKDFDNGVIKTQKSKNDNLDNDDSDNVPNNSFSRGISPNIEFNDEYIAERKSKLNSPKNRSSSSDSNGKIVIKDDLIREIERNIGYDRKYLISCLKEKRINYATATYYLLDNDISSQFI